MFTCVTGGRSNGGGVTLQAARHVSLWRPCVTGVSRMRHGLVCRARTPLVVGCGWRGQDAATTVARRLRHPPRPHLAQPFEGLFELIEQRIEHRVRQPREYGVLGRAAGLLRGAHDGGAAIVETP